MTNQLRYVSALALLMCAGGAFGDAPSFGKQIKPFLDRYCTECHGQNDPDADLRLDTFGGIVKGGRKGSILTPGKPDASKLVLLVEKKGKPAMPPKRKKQPNPSEVALLRAWVASGAKNDIGSSVVRLPKIAPRAKIVPPVTAVSYSPDGKHLVAGAGSSLWLIDSGKGTVVDQSPALSNPVSALALSRDGKRLAVAVGAPGKSGSILLYNFGKGPNLAEPTSTIDAHNDRIHDLAFSPDGAVLASASYDRVVKLWNVADSTVLRELKDHSDAVYSVAWSPDGVHLASASADRAVKVWNTKTGKRLYTLGESTDWVYSVAWSPDGKHVAAAGVDKSIRVWKVSSEEGIVVHSVFAHSGPVTGLIYSKDGGTLYSLGEDKTVKIWDARKMVERKLLPKQPDTVLGLGVRADGKQLALGRYDGTLALLDEGGKLLHKPLPANPKAVLQSVSPAQVVRGKTTTLQLRGKFLGGVTSASLSLEGAKVDVRAGGRLEVGIPKTAGAGTYDLIVENSAGNSNALKVVVDLFDHVKAVETVTSPRRGQVLPLPASVSGTIGQDGDVDYFRIDAKVGDEIAVHAVAGAGSKLAPNLQLFSPGGQVLIESTDGLLGHRCTESGMHVLALSDREYRGNASMTYRLHVGPIPIVTSCYPMGVRRGSEQTIHLEGVYLGKSKSVSVRAKADQQVGSKIALPISTPWGKPMGETSVVVGEHAEVTESAIEKPLPIPATANGRIDSSGSPDVWTVHAKKGQRLVAEVEAERIGSPMDSVIEVLDAEGRPVPRAVLRSIAKTYTTFRDHDSRKPGIRIETWTELAIDDYMLVGTELLRIKALPRNPDDDCQFYQEAGRRRGFLGTTPIYHPPGKPMYKVQLHPPGTTFPPNGLPVVTLYYRNDDGTRRGKDSYLIFDPPADGAYRIRVGDSRSQGSSRHVYRLTVRKARPSFSVSVSPKNPKVSKGGAIPVTVSVVRNDGFDGAVDVELQGLPKGFHAPKTSIPASENSTSFALFAEPSADAKGAKAMTLEARAEIDGKDQSQSATVGVPTVVALGDIMTSTAKSEVTIRPGSRIRILAKVERRNGFKGRIPLEVKGLPPGVRVLNVGLNGILITEKETERWIVIYAEPWTEPMERPIVVLAKREGKNTQHAARSVLLRVEPKP